MPAHSPLRLPLADIVANLARPIDTRSSAPTTSIAVLPFVNMSDDPADTYFSDGLAEEILNLLAQSPELKVTARTSSFALRDEQEDVRRIGEMLGVAHVLEGSVRRAGNVVRVTAQLIDTLSGFHEWSETFDRELTDVFAIQDEISGAIAEALEVTIASGESPAVLQRRTDDLEAYDYYLLGRHAWAGRTDGGDRVGPRLLRAGDRRRSGVRTRLLGSLRCARRVRLLRERRLPRGRGPGSGRGSQGCRARARTWRRDYASLGLIEMEFDWDLEAADSTFTRAREMNPGYLPVWHWAADLATILRGDTETAIAFGRRRGIELDPMSPMSWWALGAALAVRRASWKKRWSRLGARQTSHPGRSRST